MAIPGIPGGFIVQQANQEILVSWDLTVGATSYDIVRSEDNVTYTALASVSGSPLAVSYLDTSAQLETQYFYKVRATNADGSSSYTSSQSAVPTPTGEMTLGQIRLEAQQSADRVNSNFVTKSEWNSFIRLACDELYDLLITVYEDYNVADPILLQTNGSTYSYNLPNGTLTFLDANNPAATIVAKPFYKLLGVDLALQNSQNAYVTVNKYNFIDRNTYLYPNTASTIYGVFNMRYRIVGKKINFIPTPSGNQLVRLWYIPRLTALLKDTDTTDIGISGWLRYVVVRAAKYALDKEESDSTKQDQELMFLKARIEETAANRDAGSPDTISDTKQSGYGKAGYPGNGFGAGF